MGRLIDRYMGLEYPIQIIPDENEGGYVVTFPDLPGCLTCGDTLESALANAKDAKKEWLVAALELGLEIPQPNTKFSKNS